MNNLDGWVNTATFHYVLEVWNDRQYLEALDSRILFGMTNAENMVKMVPRGTNWDGPVDIISVIYTRMDELISDGRLIKQRYLAVDAILKRSSSSYGKYNEKVQLTSTKLPKKQNPKKENKTMLITSVKTVHLVNGTDITKMDLDDKVSLIAATEKKIAELKAVKTTSKMITAEIKKLEKFLVDAVSLFDSNLD